MSLHAVGATCIYKFRFFSLLFDMYTDFILVQILIYVTSTGFEIRGLFGYNP